MSFGIFSGTASNGLGCCAPAASARHADTQATATRRCAFIVSSPVVVELRSQSAENLDSCGGNLLVFMRLHAGDANTSDADSFHDDGQPAIVEGICVGGVGVSGVQSHEDEQIAAAGIKVLG